MKETFGDTKGVTRRRKSKDKQYNGQRSNNIMARGNTKKGQTI
jgi:hypothetical protein